MGICQKNLFHLKSVNTNLQRSNDDYNCTLGGAKIMLPVSAEHDYTVTDLLWSQQTTEILLCHVFSEEMIQTVPALKRWGLFTFYTKLKSPPLLREIIFLFLNKQTHPPLLCIQPLEGLHAK